MIVLVVDVWEVHVAVLQLAVTMRVCMRLCTIPFELMQVLVMHIVSMRVGMRQIGVLVFVHMLFGEVQGNSHRHQRGRHPERGAGGFSQHHD